MRAVEGAEIDDASSSFGFPCKPWITADSTHEAAVRREVRAVLVERLAVS